MAVRMVWTGTLASAGSALVVPSLLFLLGVLASGTWSAFDSQWLVAYAGYSLVAAPIWALFGALAGLACWIAWSWSYRCGVLVRASVSGAAAGTVVAIPTGVVLGFTFGQPVLGFGTAAFTWVSAFLVTAWSIWRSLARDRKLRLRGQGQERRR